jgi:hypothetical protein
MRMMLATPTGMYACMQPLILNILQRLVYNALSCFHFNITTDVVAASSVVWLLCTGYSFIVITALSMLQLYGSYDVCN